MLVHADGACTAVRQAATKVGRRHGAALRTALLLFSGWLSTGCGTSPDAGSSTGALTPKTLTPSSPELVALGQQAYVKNCAACHGVKGDGLGEAAYLLFPKPRNLVKARFRLVSTWDFTPTDEDLFRTISRGMPGSAMPAWAALTEKTRWGLVHYIKSFARYPFEIGPDHQPLNTQDRPTGRIKPPPEPAYTPEAQTRIQQIFKVRCAGCHGLTGKGDGQQKQEDSEGFPTRPRDLTVGIYKGSPEPAQVYNRILGGMPGSPMPSHKDLYGNDGWGLVQYVLAMSSDEQRARAEMKRFRIVATRVNQLPSHPDAAIWRSTPTVNLHLMPLWWRNNRPEIVTVQALHDGKEIAIQLAWSDSTHDHTAMRPQDFRDAAAIEFSLAADPPFFAMGEAAKTVNIWMWKAERQADLEPAFQDLDKIYPHLGIDSYPNSMRSPVEQPSRNALTLDSDPTFVTGWGAKNIVSDPTRKSSAEDLTAKGFGTLRARPIIDQKVTAWGVYSTGSYRAIFRRSLKSTGTNSVAIERGSIVPVSFAVWDGSAGDRDGKKSVTIWQELFVAN